MTSLLEKLVADADNKAIADPLDWNKRHIDSHIRMKWCSAMETIPACRDKGIMGGFHIYPDGRRVPFTLS